MRLLMTNTAILGIFVLLMPACMSIVPKISSRYSFVVSLGFYIIAAFLLNDFGTKASSLGQTSDSISLFHQYVGGIKHTFAHIAWPLVVNICFAVAFGALLSQSNGFAAVPMAIWLMTALFVSIAVSFWQLGSEKILSTMSPELVIGLVATIVACVCFQMHNMRAH